MSLVSNLNEGLRDGFRSIEKLTFELEVGQEIHHGVDDVFICYSQSAWGWRHSRSVFIRKEGDWKCTADVTSSHQDHDVLYISRTWSLVLVWDAPCKILPIINIFSNLKKNHQTASVHRCVCGSEPLKEGILGICVRYCVGMLQHMLFDMISTGWRRMWTASVDVRWWKDETSFP